MIIKIFIRCWLIYWFLIFIAPFRAITESPWIGILVQLVFFISVLVGYFSIPFGFSQFKIQQHLNRPHKVYLRLFWLSLFMSILGSLFLTFDRIVIQGISFSDGLAVAREKWREAGEQRGGAISSIYSVLAYFLAPAFYYSIINLVVYKDVHINKVKIKWIIILALVVWNTVLTGGRSVAFVALIMFLASQLYNRQFFASKQDWKASITRYLFVLKKSTLIRNSIILLLVSYSLYIFASRSEASSMPVISYVDQALEGLGLEMYPFVNSIAYNVPFADIFYLFALFLGYLLHSYVVVTKIYLYPYPNTSLVLFTGIGLILAKIGIIPPPDTEWFLAGSFPSLPGSLYLQGGFALMIIFGLFLGFGSRLVTLLIQRFPNNSMLLFSYIIFVGSIITSPVLFIFDSLMFPFILIQFVFFSVLLKLRLR